MTRVPRLPARRSAAPGVLAWARRRAGRAVAPFVRRARKAGRRVGADRTGRIAIAATAGLPPGAALMTATNARPAAVAWLLVAVVLAAVVGQWDDPLQKKRS